MIPKNIHFIYLTDEKLNCRTFTFSNYISIKSFRVNHPTFNIYVHYNRDLVNNVWWSKSKQYATFVKIDDVDISLDGAKYIEHKTDILRLKILNKFGGIYVDCDTICVKPFDKFLDKKCVMGQEVYEYKFNGLCNAVVISEPNGVFINKWINEYKDFNSDVWNQFSTQTPNMLSKLFPEEISIEPHWTFFKFTWGTDDISELYYKNDLSKLDNICSIHLWSSKTYQITQHMSNINNILETNSLFNHVCRKYISL